MSHDAYDASLYYIRIRARVTAIIGTSVISVINGSFLRFWILRFPVRLVDTMIPPQRTHLPDRRPSHLETLEVGGQTITACIGFDPATGAEHMDTSYLWRASKHGHWVHIENPETERAYCQVENCGGKPLDGRGADIPPGRRLCKNCVGLAGRDGVDYREPNIKVLLGERLAEAEPELFAGTVAPRLWKRGKQVWPAHRSKGRKPKRSQAKYLRVRPESS